MTENKEVNEEQKRINRINMRDIRCKEKLINFEQKKKSIEQLKAELDVVLKAIKEEKQKQRLKEVSDYFMNNNNTDKLTRNMSETIRYFEQNLKEVLVEMMTENDNKKLKVSEFHKLLRKLIKQ